MFQLSALNYLKIRGAEREHTAPVTKPGIPVIAYFLFFLHVLAHGFCILLPCAGLPQSHKLNLVMKLMMGIVKKTERHNRQTLNL